MLFFLIHSIRHLCSVLREDIPRTKTSSIRNHVRHERREAEKEKERKKVETLTCNLTHLDGILVIGTMSRFRNLKLIFISHRELFY